MSETEQKLDAGDPLVTKLCNVINGLSTSRGNQSDNYTFSARQENPDIIVVNGIMGDFDLITKLRKEFGYQTAGLLPSLPSDEEDHYSRYITFLDRRKLESLSEQKIAALLKPLKVEEQDRWAEPKKKYHPAIFNPGRQEPKNILYVKLLNHDGKLAHCLVSPNKGCLAEIRGMRDVAPLIYGNHNTTYGGVLDKFAGHSGLFSVHLNRDLVAKSPDNIDQAIGLLNQRGFEVKSCSIVEHGPLQKNSRDVRIMEFLNGDFHSMARSRASHRAL